MKKSFFSILTLVASLVLVACGSAESDTSLSSDKTSEVVTIGYQKGNTINILKERGNLDEALKDMGYQVEWKVFPTGTVLLEALNTNNIDFGHASDGNAVFMQAGGHSLQYVAAESPYPEGVALVAKEESSIETVADFVGKTIGVTKGGNQHYLLLVALKEAGISLDDVTIKFYKDAAEGLAAFTNGEFDVYGSWDPYLAIVEDKIATKTIVSGSDLTENRTFYFATEALLDEKSDVVSVILEELQNADQWANENKEEVANILATELGLEEEPFEKANNRREFGVEKIDDAILSSQQQLADTFYDANLLEKEITIEEAVNIDDEIIPNNIN